MSENWETKIIFDLGALFTLVTWTFFTCIVCWASPTYFLFTHFPDGQWVPHMNVLSTHKKWATSLPHKKSMPSHKKLIERLKWHKCYLLNSMHLNMIVHTHFETLLSVNTEFFFIINLTHVTSVLLEENFARRLLHWCLWIHSHWFVNNNFLDIYF